MRTRPWMKKVFKKPGDRLRERRARVWFKENNAALKKHPVLLESLSLIEPLMEPRFKETSREVSAAREVMAGVVQALMWETQIRTQTRYSGDAYSRNPFAAWIDFPGFIGSPKEKLSKEDLVKLKTGLPKLIDWVHRTAKAYRKAFDEGKPLSFHEPRPGTELHEGKAVSMKDIMAAKELQEQRTAQRKRKSP